MKNALFFLLGAGIGFAAAYFGLKQKFENMAEAEIDEIREYYQNKAKEKRHAHPVKEKDPLKEAEQKKSEEIIAYNRYSAAGSLAKINEKQLDPLHGSCETAAKAADEEGGIPDADRCDAAPVDEDAFDEDALDDYPHDERPGPYLISSEEFGEESNFDTETLYFYDENGVMLDDTDCFLDNVERIIGEDTLSCFGDDDRIYVRNERIGTDFEIIRYHAAYEE